MKKFFLLAFSLWLTAFAAQGQRYAIIDTRYILDKLPDYKQAQKQLDDIAAEWQKDIDGKQAELDKMYKDYDAEQVMLSDDLKKKEKINFSRRKKNSGTYSGNVLGLKETFSRKDKNLLSLSRIRYITLCKNLLYSGDMSLYSTKVRELLLSLPTPNWIKVKMC